MTQVLEKSRPRLAPAGYPRIDGFERVTGNAKYGGDWKVPDMLYGRVIKSTFPSGMVRRINTEKAAAIGGVEAVITCFDDKTLWGPGEREHQRRVFTDRVRFVGDCVGAVAAKTRNIACEAVENVEVEYEELPAVFTIEEALKPGAPRVWDDRSFIGPITYGFGDADAAFKRAEFVFEGEYSTSRVHNAPLEPACSLAWWENDNLTVVAGSQAIFTCRESLAKDLSMPIEKVRVITLYKGGGFGNKNRSMNYDLVAALLARKTRKPVMVEYSREEDFIGVHGRWSSVQHIRSAVTKTGRILAFDVKAHCDVGAYTRHIKEGKFIEGPEGYYSCEAWRAEVYGVYTNTPSTAHMRAPTGPQSCFGTETLVDEIAHKLGVDPFEFRVNNAVVMHANEESFTSNGLKDCLRIGADAFGWKRKWRRPPSSIPKTSESKLTGVGVAMASWHALLGKGEALVRALNDGVFEVYTGVVDIGTGAKSTMAVIASRTLGVPLGRIRVVWGDTRSCPYSIGESGSRTTSFTGYAVKEASLKVKDKVLALAAAQSGSKAEDLVLSDGVVRNRETGRKMGVGEVLAKANLSSVEERAVTEPVLPEHVERAAFAAHFVETGVDPETGEISIERYVAAHESGEIVNALTAESQVQGGVVMGLGMALSERILIDPNSGSIQNPSLLTYRLPNHVTVPKIEVIFTDTEDPFGPKSLGEVSVVPAPAAVGNAIFNATGVRLRRLPFTSEELLGAMNRV